MSASKSRNASILALALALAAPACLSADRSGSAPRYAASIVTAAWPSREGPDHWLRVYALEGDRGLRYRDHELDSLGIATAELGFNQRESHRYDFRIYGRALYILSFDRSGSASKARGYWVNEGDRMLVFEIGPDLRLEKRAELLLMGSGRRTRVDEQFYQYLDFLETGVWFAQWSAMTGGVRVLRGWSVGENPLAPEERVLDDRAASGPPREFDPTGYARPYGLMALLHALGGDAAAAEDALPKYLRKVGKNDSVKPYGSTIKIGDSLYDPRTGKSFSLPKDQAGAFVYSYNDNWVRPDRAYLQRGGREVLVCLGEGRLRCFDLREPAAPRQAGELRIGYGYDGASLVPIQGGLLLVAKSGHVAPVAVAEDLTLSLAWGPETLAAALVRGDLAEVRRMAAAMVDPRICIEGGKSVFEAALERGAGGPALEALLDASLGIFGAGPRYGSVDSAVWLQAALKRGDLDVARAVLARFPAALGVDGGVHELASRGETVLLERILALEPGLAIGARTDQFGILSALFEAKDEATRKILVAAGAAERTRLDAPFPVYCVDQAVRIRASPTLDAKVIGQANYGEEYLLVGRSHLRFEAGGQASTWIQIRLPSGQEGWSFGGFYSRSRPLR